MTATQEKIETKHLESLINTAIKKIQGKKENDICRYLPIETGGYIHHFTMKKMKTTAPQALQLMISKYIIEAEKPTTVKPKQRAARGSRKRRDHVILSKQDLEAVLQLARATNNKDIIRKLTPKKDLRSLKKELIASIRHGEIEPELWNMYVETISHSSAILSTI